MVGSKRKRSASPIGRAWNKLLLADAFDFVSRDDPRTTTRTFSRLVCYPEMIFDVGRTTNFQRVDDNTYAFDIRHKRYLGRGSYTLSARAIGTITTDDETGITRVYGYVRQGAFYFYTLICMTLFVLVSYALVPVSILFLPLAVLMSGVICLHWRYLVADRRDLYREIEALIVNDPQRSNLKQIEAS